VKRENFSRKKEKKGVRGMGIGMSVLSTYHTIRKTDWGLRGKKGC